MVICSTPSNRPLFEDMVKLKDNCDWLFQTYQVEFIRKMNLALMRERWERWQVNHKVTEPEAWYGNL